MLTPNIDGKGRKARFVLGGLLLTGGISFLFVPRPWPALATAGFLSLLAGGVFVLFEAARGWCALRACGIKTPL
ncbi:MAG: hypothetical protein ACT4O3_10210 [Elusimicrobiota bacterium]